MGSCGAGPAEWDDDDEWPEWESLDYVAKDVYESATGSAGESAKVLYDAVRLSSPPQYSSDTLKGNAGTLGDEAIAAVKIPLVAAQFSLS